MALSEQCPRESRALHSDYYRAAKKSALPLNEACTRHLRHCILCPNAHERSSPRRNQSNRAMARQETLRHHESTDEIRISYRSFARSRGAKNCIRSARERVLSLEWTRSERTNLLVKKNSPTDPESRLDSVESDANRANRSKVIRFRAFRGRQILLRARPLDAHVNRARRCARRRARFTIRDVARDWYDDLARCRACA